MRYEIQLAVGRPWPQLQILCEALGVLRGLEAAEAVTAEERQSWFGTFTELAESARSLPLRDTVNPMANGQVMPHREGARGPVRTSTPRRDGRGSLWCMASLSDDQPWA